MLMNFPRHTFTPDEYDKTLLELGLVPNGTIIVIVRIYYFYFYFYILLVLSDFLPTP